MRAQAKPKKRHQKKQSASQKKKGGKKKGSSKAQIVSPAASCGERKKKKTLGPKKIQEPWRKDLFICSSPNTAHYRFTWSRVFS